MRTKSIDLYQYAELDDGAKDKAREWFRQGSADDSFWAECPIDEFKELLAALGFEIGKRAIEYSGFSSQGDGAAFSGSWRANKCNPAALLADRPHTYKDENGNEQTSEHNKRWHDACAPLVELANKYPNATGSVSNSHRGFFMSLDSFDDGIDRDEETHTLGQWAEIDNVRRETGTDFIEACRDLAHTFYRTLESEYDYQNSDEQIAELLEMNEYEFTAEGERA